VVAEGYRKQETWHNRAAYWMAAIGSAVGLGNIWRFPQRVYSNGGGAFLVAYFIVLFLVGMPTLTQEMALGQKFQGGDVEAYGRINWRMRGIGLASVIGVFVIVCYYSVIISYSLVFAVRSLESPQPWAYDGTWGNFSRCVSMVGGGDENCTAPDSTEYIDCPKTCSECENNAEKYFDDMTQIAADIYSGNGKWSEPLLIATAVVWICIYFSVVKGVTSVSYVVYVTMPVPCLFLLILLIKALTLSGADDGIEEYLTTDISRIGDAQLWLDAVGQCFFSLSVCMGVMTAYASFTQKGSVALDEKVVAFADVSIAFISGFCIYGVLGHLNNRSDDACADVNYLNKGGTALVFIAIPTALLTFEASGFFSFLFFFMLFLLGVDSAFSMIEACTTVVCDTDFATSRGWTKTWVSLALCLLAFLIAVPFCTDVGPYHMDIFDNYVSTKGMIFVGMMETFALGWVYLVEDQANIVGVEAVKIWNIGYWATLILATVISFCMSFPRYTYTLNDDDEPVKGLEDFNGGVGHYSVWVGFAICVIGWGGSLAYSLQKAKNFNEKLDTRAALWGITGWLGCEEIRKHVNSAGGTEEWESTPEEEKRMWMKCDFSKLSIVWGWLVKYFIPGFLFVLLADQLRKEEYAPMMGLKPGSAYQLEGMIPFILMLLCIFAVMVYPESMEQEYDHKKAGKGDMTTTMEMVHGDEKGENV